MKYGKVFPKTDHYVNSFLHEWISYHTHIIETLIAKIFIKVIRYNRNVATKTEVCEKLNFQVSTYDLHIDIPEKSSVGFYMLY